MKAQVHAAIAAGRMVALGLAWALGSQAASPTFDLQIEQVTSGSKHHFFGYIGQCRTVPWNASGRYILGLEIDHVDRMPSPEDSATVILVDTHQGNKQIIYDADTKKVVGQLGSPEIFPNPEGDIALSPDGNWLANGYTVGSQTGSKNYYTIYRLSDGSFARSPGLGVQSNVHRQERTEG